MDSKRALAAAKLRATAGRAAVLESLSAEEGQSAADILHRLDSAVAPATVYRSLLSLCVAGLAKRIPADNGALYMLADSAAAPRLVCSRCGKVEEVQSPPAVRRYNAELMKNRGVDSSAAMLMVADCKRKECQDS